MKTMTRTTFIGLIALVTIVSLGAAAADAVGEEVRRYVERPVDTAEVPPPLAVVDGTPRPRTSGLPTTPVLQSEDRDRRSSDPKRERIVAGLGTVIGDQGMAAQIGGDDIAILNGPDAEHPFIQIASNGTIFVAMNNSTEINIYRSIDGGDNWTHWSTFDDPGGPSHYLQDFEIAEGTQDRVFLVYGINVPSIHVRVAYASIAAPVPTWTVVTALGAPGVSYAVGLIGIDMDTDQEAYDSYYLYVVATGFDADGVDVWFNVSTNQGASFGTPYRIVNNTGGSSISHRTPKVRFGFGNWIHVTFEKFSSPSPPNPGLFYLRAPNFAAGGSASWESVQTLNDVGPSSPAKSMGLEASLIDGAVIAVDFAAKIWYSLDSGATWPHEAHIGVLGSNDQESPVLISPTGEVAVLNGKLGTCPTSFCLSALHIQRSTTTDLETWTPSYESALSILPDIPTNQVHRPGLASDPSRGGRLAAVWWSFDYDDEANNMVRFDAEWRRDPGYANTEVGFPVDIAGGGQTPPAVAQVDLDAQLEIVFATRSGDVHVVNHDGSAVPGWPVNIGVVPFDGPVAVGDLVGNGNPTIVAANQAGVVHAFDRNGTPLPGWPVDLGTGASAYVSIGALGPPHPRYVVAVSGTQMHVLNYLGVNVAPAWSNIPVGVYTRPAAIGDMENDGITEIVSVAGPNLYNHWLNDSVFKTNHVAGEVFSDAPTLADIDLDGDLEVAIPTESGKMYLFETLDDLYPGWPITVSPGVSLTSAAMAQILGTWEAELVFAESDGDVHIRYHTGVEQSGFPKDASTSVVYMPPMLSPVSISGSNINIGTTESVGHSYRNTSSNVTPGWPRNLPGQVEETFAAGDIDNDGHNEIVVLGLDFLTVFDVGVAPIADPRGHWPMYGYDEQRTGCLACIETLTAIGDTPTAAGSLTLDVSPNPFNPATLVEYEIVNDGPVSLFVYDVSGTRVATLLDNEHRAAGRHSLRYQAATASGVYFMKLVSGGQSTVRKLVLLK